MNTINDEPFSSPMGPDQPGVPEAANSDRGADLGSVVLTSEMLGVADTTAEKPDSKELYPGQPLTDSIKYLTYLMEERNTRELPETKDRTNHMFLAHAGIGGLLTQPKLDQEPEERLRLLRIDTSKTFLRIVTLLEKLGTPEEFVGSLLDQYKTCHRCHGNPCGCNPSQAGFEEQLPEATEITENSSLEEWQAHFKRLYGGNNAMRDLVWMGEKLGAELGESLTEVTRMLKVGDGEKKEAYRERAIEELAQVTAWLLGICVHPEAVLHGKDIPLEQVLVKLYGEGCPNCGNKVCTCGEFSLEESRKDLTADRLLGKIEDLLV